MTLLKALQRLSGTKKDMAGAANAWAGTTGLEVLGALNAKAGTHGLGFNAVQKLLGGAEGDSGLDSVSEVPGAPSGVSAVRGNAQATVSWGAVAGTGSSTVTGYRVTTSPGGATTTVGAVTSTTITGLTNGTAYTFTVAAIDAEGIGPESAASAAVTPATTPGTPTSVAATPGDTQATVTWVAPASTGGTAITGYRITTSPGGATTDVGAVLTGTVTGLTNGTSYTFTVKALNAVGYGSDSSASSSVAPIATPPGTMAAWYKADTIALADGAAVGTWTDSSANARDLAQATTAKKPVYVAVAANGHAGVRFLPAGPSYLERLPVTPTLLSGASGFTCAAVFSQAGRATGASQFLYFAAVGTGGATGTTRARAALGSTTGYPTPGGRRLDGDTFASIIGTSGSQASLSTYSISTQTVDFANAQGSAWKNGALVLGPSALLTAGTVSATGSVAQRIGTQDSTTGYLDATICELIVYERALTAPELTALHSYLGQKYGITVS